MADKFQVFEDWLVHNGARFPKLELRDYGNEVRGVHAKSHLKEDEIIVEIPQQLLITVEMGKETDIGRKILDSDIELDAPKHIFLMLFMLIDRKRPDSFFKPYYDTLPATLSNMPIFWSGEELSELAGSFLLTQIAERKAAIENDYKSICDLCPEFVDVCTMHEFSVARMMVCSRNFGIMINGLKTAALVPLADMLNHYRPRHTKWEFDDGLDSFTITTLDGIGGGCQVYDSYGQKDCHRFLLNYGFAPESNVEPDGYNPNEVPLVVSLDEGSDPLFMQKILTFGLDGNMPSRRIRVTSFDGEAYRTLFAFLRIAVANDADMSMLMHTRSGASLRHIHEADTYLNHRNEYACLMKLKTLLTSLLAQYPRTLEEDMRLLRETIPSSSSSSAASDSKDGAHEEHKGEERESKADDSSDAPNYVIPMYSNRRHAMIQVRGEKEVLHTYMRLCDLGMGILDSTHDGEVQQFTDQIRQEAFGNAVIAYIRMVAVPIYYTRKTLRIKEARERAEREDREDMTRRLAGTSVSTMVGGDGSAVDGPSTGRRRPSFEDGKGSADGEKSDLSRPTIL